MPLDDADRSRLEEIERALTREAPDVARALSAGRRPVTRVVAVLLAAAVFLGALSALSVLVANALPVLLALPVGLVLLRWPHFARADRGWEPPATSPS